MHDPDLIQTEYLQRHHYNLSMWYVFSANLNKNILFLLSFWFYFHYPVIKALNIYAWLRFNLDEPGEKPNKRCKIQAELGNNFRGWWKPVPGKIKSLVASRLKSQQGLEKTWQTLDKTFMKTQQILDKNLAIKAW